MNRKAADKPFINFKKDNGEYPITSLEIPWQSTDIISSNCPTHIGTRMDRINDETFRCPKGGEVYKPMGSIPNQTNRDNYYLGLVLKG